MPFLRKLHNDIGYTFWCPGCKDAHWIPVPRWAFNGDMEKPTFSPSVRHFIPAMNGNPEVTMCHYHIQEGQFKYCDDCQHELKGKTVPMEAGPSDSEYGWPG